MDAFLHYRVSAISSYKTTFSHMKWYTKHGGDWHAHSHTCTSEHTHTHTHAKFEFCGFFCDSKLSISWHFHLHQMKNFAITSKWIEQQQKRGDEFKALLGNKANFSWKNNYLKLFKLLWQICVYHHVYCQFRMHRLHRPVTHTHNMFPHIWQNILFSVRFFKQLDWRAQQIDSIELLNW